MRYLPAVCLLVTLSIGGCNASNSPSDEQGGVLLLRYAPGSESTEQREQGFLDTLKKKYPTINILSDDQYSGTTPESALDKSQQLITKFGDRITGVFCVCEPNATGMLNALQEAGLAGKVKFVGFDPTPPMVNAMRQGQMDGIVLQDPVTMGYLAVRTMADHLAGKPVEQRVSTGEFVATPANMKSAQMQRLLKPPLMDGGAFEPREKKYVVAVIPKGTTHEFWRSVHFGADRAARELGNVEIRWKGPLLENDREGQMNVVQDFITQRVDGICLAPLDARALVDVVKEAKDEGIPTVIFDSDLADKDAKISYVATDNYHGGALAADCLAAALGANLDQDSPPSEAVGPPSEKSAAAGEPSSAE